MISNINKIQEAPAAKPVTTDSLEDTASTTHSSPKQKKEYPQEQFTLREKLGTVLNLLTFDPKKVTNWAFELQ